MKIPNIDCKIEMLCSINSSEDPNKIKIAIANIFPESNIEIKNYSVGAISNDLNSLEKIYEIIQSKQSQKTYRRNLEKNVENNTTWFYLNKQAAFAGKIAICEEAEESPLGPIKVILNSSNIDRIINWMIFRDDET
ncbi:MAG: RNA-binding domain-containing protein [Nitrosopumilus sp.]